MADWLTIALGIIIGIILISLPKEKRSTRRRREEDELDDWDLQDQLEGDET